jgi:hypothetical protein
VSAYNSDLIRDLEQQFDDEDAKPDADLSKLRYLKSRADELRFKAVELMHEGRRHMEERMAVQEAKYRPMYEEGRGAH